jgi:hypothetical protein
MADEAKLHHTVPQFYLRGFADDAARITTVRLPGEKRYTSRVKNTAAINRFYSIDGHPKGADAFEKALSDLEGSAASILRMIERGTWPLSEEQRGALATFLVVQYLRGPDHRRTLEYLGGQMISLEAATIGRENVQDWVKDRYGLELDEDEAEAVWQQASQPGGPPVTISPVEHIKEILQTAQELLKYVWCRPWTLIRFGRRSLITSDSPVGLVPRPGSGPGWGVGFLTAWGITFPLTRRLGLVMGDVESLAKANVPMERVRAGKLDRVEPATTRLAMFINDVTVHSASEYLYHHPDDGAALPSPLPEPTLTNIVGPSPEALAQLFSID